jgi:hypothetical protein
VREEAALGGRSRPWRWLELGEGGGGHGDGVGCGEFLFLGPVGWVWFALLTQKISSVSRPLNFKFISVARAGETRCVSGSYSKAKSAIRGT